MTNEISYREKGRAVFLAALMVMSVVAMSAAFAGAAAANHADEEYEVSDNGTAWQGQAVLVTGVDEGDGTADLYQGTPDNGGDFIREVDVDSDGVELDTSDLEQDSYYITGDDGEDTVFNIRGQSLDASFDVDSVSADGDATLDIDSNRGNFHAEVSSEAFSQSELSDLFESYNSSATDEHDDEDYIVVDARDEFDLDFSNVDVDDGDEIEFTIEAADTTAEDTASVQIIDADIDYYFVDVDTVSQGDLAEITIGVEGTDEAAVMLGYEDDFSTVANITGIEDDEVVLQYNTYNTTDAWSVVEGADGIDTQNTSGQLGEHEPLPAWDWNLNVGNALDESETGLESDFDRDRLIVQDREDIGGVSTHTAPADDDVYDGFDNYDDATVTETDTFAMEDGIIFVLEDYGAAGGLDNIENEGISFEASPQSTGPVDSSEPVDLDLELLTDDLENYDGDLVYAVNLTAADLVAGQTYDGELTIDADANTFMSADDDNVTEEFEFSVVDRELEWDDIDSLPADSDATATGTTTIAPGTVIDANADSASDQGGFVDYTDTVVDDDYAFAAEFDLEGEEVGVLFDITAEDLTVDNNADDAVLEGLTLTSPSDEDASGIDLGADYDAEITTEESTDIDAVVTNNDGDEVTVDLELELDGEVYTDEVTVDGDDSETVTLTTADGADLGEGDFDFTITAESGSDDASYDGTLTVTEADDGEDDSDDSDDSDADDGDADDGDADDGDADDSDDDADDDDDGTPGFGVAVAVVALLAAAMLALRRQN
ncbi:BGTF surface domain-containing protein [Natronorubrum texcoconense]|uniref:PGF-CTERM protein/surface glycoprotein n=1 Tax=Natronorubrum texcoconense TaxID=1095776 RepID=A0A1G8UQD5_9EURY|nr:BGTF surface domain-containing protein [Natronorubrum texcoconense]SDJ56008.1 PGF-CTERM protein/surface glycoprotein [Natronorubrum texcoconense]